MLITLDFSQIKLPCIKIDGELFVQDIIRKKNILLTPEEWVRQNLIHYLIFQCNYPKSLFSIETGLKYAQKQKRTDILVYDREAEPFLLIECKALDTELNQTVLNQLGEYNHILQAKYVAISNGSHFLGYEMDYLNQKHTVLAQIPTF